MNSAANEQELRERIAELEADLKEAVAALRLMQRALRDTMPGVRYIAVQDYALLNDAPIAASNVIAKHAKKG